MNRKTLLTTIARLKGAVANGSMNAEEGRKQIAEYEAKLAAFDSPVNDAAEEPAAPPAPEDEGGEGEGGEDEGGEGGPETDPTNAESVADAEEKSGLRKLFG